MDNYNLHVNDTIRIYGDLYNLNKYNKFEKYAYFRKYLCLTLSGNIKGIK